ncbi:alpha/beta-hydrolase [Auriscalpium vulgare]|uniref:Alpha/beta-hydrolase n=1 Tax=Auriscalpium vulgare TaxID=40419 RepID=A0ACB8R8A3_9AGAM|nr:alpha/beta-hydrolase [Auriscalpium vulgare]
MIDHLVGRPSPSWKRAQVFLVIIFWLWRITWGESQGPRILWIRRINRKLRRFTPWQIVVSTLTAVYAIRNLDKISGLGAPEPLARLYSPSYYRATWISTGLDAGFATAMSIRPKWFRDFCSILFSVYYIIYANEADEKIRRFRAVPTVEMLRVTWEKTTNPYIRLLTYREPLAMYRKILLRRPKSSPYTRPITAHLYFKPDPTDALALQEDLVLDFPGGGFVAMTPEHHDERLRLWASKMGRPVLSIEYGKAPEYPYPFAIDEAFDTYRVLVESKGKVIGMSGTRLNIIMTGDSAGATMATGVLIKVLEHKFLVENASSPYPAPSSLPPEPLPLPVALVLSYAALDFNFTSWMTPTNLRVLREETEADENRPRARSPVVLTRRSSSFFYRSDGDDDATEGWASGLRGAKDHLSHVSPLAVVGDERKRISLRRKKSWGETLKLGLSSVSPTVGNKPIRGRRSMPGLRKPKVPGLAALQRAKTASDGPQDGDSEDADGENDERGYFHLREQDRPIEARVRWFSSVPHSPPASPLSGSPSASGDALSMAGKAAPLGNDLLNVHEQAKLEAAVAQADNEVADQRKREGVERKNAPIGTRLTMTSRTGYFQDRIVSPSMMRAMAILYIGPHRNPDFASDYHISPILTPSQLLAQFPPLLMQCGEKDPFVDDTIIFAGRVREAKRQRKEELRPLLDERSGIKVAVDSLEFLQLQEELDRLESESEEDWVQMQIFSDWSHGYLQMPTLMREARDVIINLAAWMDGVFLTLAPLASPRGQGSSPPFSPPTDTTVSENSSGSSFLSQLWHWRSKPSPPAREEPSPAQRDGRTNPRVRIVTPQSTGIRQPARSETETDLDEVITIVPKAQRRVRGSGGSDDTVQTRPAAVRRASDEAARLGRVAEGTADAEPAARAKAAGRGASRGSRERGLGVEGAGEEPAGLGRAGTPGKSTGAGQTISEAELMRRRRLLDSHIFESEK